MNYAEIKKYFAGKRVFVTGHTGFKGTWLCKILSMVGAEVYGYSLAPATEPNMYGLLQMDRVVNSTIGDIRDFQKLKQSMESAKPEYVFHLAAQPIVRESYKNPKETFEVNVMGTINILECIRLMPGVKSFVNVTTDKVYENSDVEEHAFVEEEKLNGYDPYSNSKSCSELVTQSYRKSFFGEKYSTAISTARAGNVLGGGDFAVDRIVPDCVRATVKGENIHIRNPYSIRPYQHVLESLNVYLTLCLMQEKEPVLAGCYNVGPDDGDCVTTGELANLFVKYWKEHAKWVNMAEEFAPYEAHYLKLDCTKIKQTFGWKPVWHIEETMKNTVEWYKVWIEGGDLNRETERQIYLFWK